MISSNGFQCLGCKLKNGLYSAVGSCLYGFEREMQSAIPLAIPMLAIILVTLVMQEKSLADEAVSIVRSPQVSVQKSSQIALKDRSALEDKRLFFTTAERDAADDPTGTLDNGELQHSQSAGRVEESVVRTPTIRKTKPKPSLVKAYKINYQARIASVDRIRVIVNGSPCQSIYRENRVLPAAMDIQCHALTESHLRLTLLVDGLHMQVTDGSRSLGILLPGESL